MANCQRSVKPSSLSATVIAVVVAIYGAAMVRIGAAQGNYGDDTTYYTVLPITKIGDPEHVVCSPFLSNAKCRRKTLACPKQCPERAAITGLSCFADCSPKCEATCKHRRINCQGFGAICYDPRFVGGDGVAFYFHGKGNHHFCIVSDHHIHVNARFIGKRPEGRSRDYTWVQALGLIYFFHNFTIAAKKVSTWDESIDQIHISYDGKPVTLSRGILSTWTSPSGELRIERIEEVNSVEVLISKVMSMKVRVVPVTQKESRVHNYEIPSDDCFAHLDVQFKFYDLSAAVDGVLGQTYRPDFKTPVKVGVPMPLMGGEDRYLSSSLLSSDCKASRFQPFTLMSDSKVVTSAIGGSSTDTAERIKMITADCSGTGGKHGMMCRR